MNDMRVVLGWRLFCGSILRIWHFTTTFQGIWCSAQCSRAGQAAWFYETLPKMGGTSSWFSRIFRGADSCLGFRKQPAEVGLFDLPHRSRKVRMSRVFLGLNSTLWNTIPGNWLPMRLPVRARIIDPTAPTIGVLVVPLLEQGTSISLEQNRRRLGIVAAAAPLAFTDEHTCIDNNSG
jgi:hypothetical protein